MSALSRVKVAPGLRLRRDGEPTRINPKNKPALKHLLKRMDAAVHFSDPHARLHLLPQDCGTTAEGLPLASGHRVYRLTDRCEGGTLHAQLEVIAVHSADINHSQPHAMIAACDRAGIDHTAAIYADTPARRLYDGHALKSLLRERRAAELASSAHIHAVEGADAETVAAIANDWQDGKRDVTWEDGIEPLHDFAWLEFLVWLEPAAAVQE